MILKRVIGRGGRKVEGGSGKVGPELEGCVARFA